VGAIESIAQLLNSSNQVLHWLFLPGDMQVHQRFASLALANIALDVTSIPSMVTHAMKRAIELCYEVQPYVRRQVTRILNSIASYPTGKNSNLYAKSYFVLLILRSPHLLTSSPPHLLTSSPPHLFTSSPLHLLTSSQVVHFFLLLFSGRIYPDQCNIFCFQFMTSSRNVLGRASRILRHSRPKTCHVLSRSLCFP
jgi:hypothetical protein